MWPAERLVDRIWRLHRHEPPWRRWLGGSVLFALTIVAVLAYIVLLIAIPVGIYLLVRRLA